MNIQIIGTGIVGEATACLAKSLGHDVCGYDIKSRESPYYVNVAEPINSCDLTFVCVNETFVEAVVPKLISLEVANIVIRSTTKPGTTKALSEKHKVSLCHNPEFLREKTYLEDAIHPNFVLIGVSDVPPKPIYEFYKPLQGQGKCKVLYTDTTTSEMAKLTLNNYLATLITFWNQIDEICNTMGVNTHNVANALKNDLRVSEYGCSFFGKPFDGKCLPKDLRQLIEFAHSVHSLPTIFTAVEEFNRTLAK